MAGFHMSKNPPPLEAAEDLREVVTIHIQQHCQRIFTSLVRGHSH